MQSFASYQRALFSRATSVAQTPAPVNGVSQGDWVSKGVRFPAGTEFRADYKGETHNGKVDGGALVVSGKRFDTPSRAAMSITKNSVNGWDFWECKFPGKTSWQLITTLRK